VAESEQGERVFRALADPTRRRILDLLRDHALTTGQVCAELPELDRCTVMLHLSVLARAGLVLVRREGRFRWNYLNSVPIQRLYDRWISQYARPSVELLTRLTTDLERSAPNRSTAPLDRGSKTGPVRGAV
jgi:DNA-binding transcriptional ArsR family regulator